MPRTATVTLRTGVARANLPGARAAVAGSNYVLPWEDFERISPEALRTVIRVVSISDAPAARRSTVNLATNSTTVPTGFKLGDVEPGYQYDSFRLIKLADAVNAVDGSALCWVDKAQHTVTADRVGGTAAVPLEFAGFAMGAITAGRYAWIQVDGAADAPVVGTAGDAITLNPTVDGGVRVFTSSESALITTGTASAGTFTLTYAGQTTAGIAFNANAAAVASALVALSNISPTDVTATGTGVLTAAGGVTVTFADTLANQNLTDLTGSGAGLTGGPLTITVTQGYADAGTDVIGTSLGTAGVAMRPRAPRHARLIRGRRS